MSQDLAIRNAKSTDPGNVRLSEHKMMASADSRNVVLSGGARGIGRCLARWFLQKGHKVFIVDIDEEELRYTVDVHLKKYEGRVSFGICNLRDTKAIRATVKEAANFFDNRIDVLINNGGIATPQWRDSKNMEDERTLDEWDAFLATNLTAPFAMSQACIPYMKVDPDLAAQDAYTSGPCIIHIGSFRALQSDPDQEGYASTKAGLMGLTHSMAISCGRWGIRVNLVAPGRIKVAHESKKGDEKGLEWAQLLEDRDIEQHPTNRAGHPEDIAAAVEYLVYAGFVSGEDITVDGGAIKKKT